VVCGQVRCRLPPATDTRQQHLGDSSNLMNVTQSNGYRVNPVDEYVRLPCIQPGPACIFCFEAAHLEGDTRLRPGAWGG